VKLNSTLLDRIRIWGLSFHGLWKGGSITLPNSSTKTCPAPGNGGVVLLKVPGKAAVSRTTTEQTGDTAAGREWRNYGLISGGRYGPMGPVHGSVGSATVILIDAANVPWTLQITWAAANTYMTVRVRRFGYLKRPWAEVAWSSTVNVAVHSFFNAALSNGSRVLLTVAQNSTGREFVLGSVSLGSVNDYCNGLLKVTVSGTVNPAASDLGLTFSGTLIGGSLFQQGDKVVSDDITGDFTVTHVTTWHEYDSSLSAYTGNTMTTTKVVTNGVVVRDDLPSPPPANTAPLSWQQGDTAHSSPSMRTRVQRSVSDVTYAAWAGYHNDALKLLTVRVVFMEYEQTTEWTYLDHVGLPELTYRYPMVMYSKTACEITYAYGGTVVANRRAEHIDVSPTTNSSFIPSLGSSASTTQVTTSLDEAAGEMLWVEAHHTVPTNEVPFVFPLTIAGVAWSTPCVAAVKRLGNTGPFTWQTVKVSVPSGVDATTTIPMSTLYASWQPSTDQIAVDSEPICWF
jgi:hypothetical protein